MATVPPRWIVEPTDKAFALGSDARLECKADGFPRPSLGWKKAAGMSVISSTIYHTDSPYLCWHC